MSKDKIEEVIREVAKVISGKDEIIRKTLAAILAEGHILLEDIPGVGKTTMALAFSGAMNLKFQRLQFTPDVVPSDITGFNMYDKKTGDFIYREGVVFCNFFLADEINRTSSKTQSALLEVMQEGKVTVDGQIHVIPKPFIVLATQNPIGTAGTQMLPEAQLDRFMIQLSMGYPDIEAQVGILKNREKSDPLQEVKHILNMEQLQDIREKVRNVFVDEKIYRYVAILVDSTRDNEYIKLGVSPRGALALCNMGKAIALMNQRNYLVPEDIQEIFMDVCRHRIILKSNAGFKEKNKESILKEILNKVKAPKLDEKK